MWCTFALAAGSLQSLRNAAAQRLSGRVPAALNSWSRFAFNLPLALGLALWATGGVWPVLSGDFFVAATGAGLTQLLANIALVSAFRHGTFAGAIALLNLETVLSTLVGAWLFGEVPSATGVVGILACVAGAIGASLAGRPCSAAARPDDGHASDGQSRATALCLAAAALLVGASFGAKAAIGALHADNPWLCTQPLALPAVALLHVTWIEVLCLSVALYARDRRAFAPVRDNLRAMALVGASAFAASLCWYAAFAAGPVAYVRALGQVETLLSAAIGLWVFRQRRTLRQLPWLALIAGGMALVAA